VALTSTIYRFDIDLADADRHVYESLPLQVACHASESEEYLVARVGRRMSFAVSVTDRELTVSIDTATLAGPVERLTPW